MPITTDINTFTTNYHTNRMATLKNRLKGYTSEEIQEYIDEKNKAIEKVARDKKNMLKALKKAKRDFKVGESVMFYIDADRDVAGEIVEINMINAIIQVYDGTFEKVSRKDIIKKTESIRYLLE
tara:strand:+ start:156 stop:527 length:372 start_codon:yes stop_codon:yes gene_type:complete